MKPLMASLLQLPWYDHNNKNNKSKEDHSKEFKQANSSWLQSGDCMKIDPYDFNNNNYSYLRMYCRHAAMQAAHADNLSKCENKDEDWCKAHIRGLKGASTRYYNQFIKYGRKYKIKKQDLLEMYRIAYFKEMTGRLNLWGHK